MACGFRLSAVGSQLSVVGAFRSVQFLPVMLSPPEPRNRGAMRGEEPALSAAEGTVEGPPSCIPAGRWNSRRSTTLSGFQAGGPSARSAPPGLLPPQDDR